MAGATQLLRRHFKVCKVGATESCFLTSAAEHGRWQLLTAPASVAHMILQVESCCQGMHAQEQNHYMTGGQNLAGGGMDRKGKPE